MPTYYPLRTAVILMLSHVAGMIDLVALPLWIGALVGHYGLDYERAGLTVTLFLGGAVAACLALAPCFDRLPRRPCAIGGYALASLALVLVAQNRSWPVLLALHLLAGAGTGCALSMAHGAMGRGANPHRLFAFAGAALGVFALVFYAIVPQVMSRIGAPGLFLVMGGVMACAALGALAFPEGRSHEPVGSPAQGAASGAIPRRAWLLVIGTALLALNQSLVFSFLERIGIARGFGSGQVNAVLAAIGLVNLVPAALAGLLQRRLPSAPLAVAAAALQACLALIVTSSTTFMPYAVAAGVYAFVLIFAHTFLFGLAARIDPSGRTTALTPAMLMTGSAIGPALAGTVAHRFGFSGIGLAVGVGALACIACFVLLGRRMRQAVRGMDAMAGLAQPAVPDQPRRALTPRGANPIPPD
ncbi:MFS transporter [Massilia sp. METH4]|uniref:MFS transporter n=1 Tax=Massilia sp. METH4 TaxID=3123041 RepID=UPI0030CFC7EA